MDDVTAARRATAEGWAVLLPASWWTIDLRTEEARRGAVAALVERQVGRADDRASLRAEIRRHLVRAADDASRAGGRFMAVSLMRVGDRPVPATLTLYRLLGADLTAQGVVELEAVLRPGTTEEDRLDLAEGPVGPVLRRVTRRAGSAEVGGEDVPLLVADYWVDPGDERGLLHLSFSTPMVAVTDAMLTLFDTVVASVGPVEGA